MKTTLDQLPDLAQSFGRMKALIELEARVNTDTLFGHSIKKGFIDKQPNELIIQMILDQLKDNRASVENCVPKWIVEDIIKYWPD